MAPYRKGPPVKPELGMLYSMEVWWAGEWLKERGYLLRPRYRSGWKPSWRIGKDFYLNYEDGLAGHGIVMDAIRISDSLMVAMKRVSLSSVRQAGEEKVATLFSNDQHSTNPLNHYIRVLEVLSVPDNINEKIIVMIFMRGVMDPSFNTIGEVLQFFKEMIEGLQYMHRNNVAHRDCSINNMAMDAKSMYTRIYHPIEQKKRFDWSGGALHHSRTRCPPKYYLFDFGFSRLYDSSQPPPLEPAIKSGGYFTPEAEEDALCDPFAADVYLLGNMMCFFGCPGIHGLKFLAELVDDMMADDPAKRPTMDEVASRFSVIVQKQPWWKLRTRAVKKDEIIFLKPFRTLHHILWTFSMMLMLKPAIPCPRP
ncbi:kinase-like domain-containing protein [Rhodocollybia butyracea]|uniref:Kinase-like domain-containing protein n=1 Tax=Rhodocollybia butyracea TaxID=206335 RepID=A0A9P5Q3T0_9AGAR|nr:kinase-like domain-containing protein [Rhodocollybia butyracea]